MQRTGGQVLVDALQVHGVDTVFCVPGESYLAVLDALHDAEGAISVITCRHENGAAFMGEAYGKLTGKPGVTFVTRGPGACNGSIGVHTALQDSTPMVMFVGQVPRGFRQREAFQEVDYEAMFGPLAKWVVEVDDAVRLPEIVGRAFSTAVSGRPGPVVVSLPEDMLTDLVDVADTPAFQRVEAQPADADLARLGEMLQAASKPLVLVGGGGWSAEAGADLEAFAAANNLPVTASFRAQDIIDNGHPNFVGEVGINTNPKLAQRVRDTDLLIVIGARLGEITTQGYTLLDAPKPAQGLVHVFPDAGELGRVYLPDLAINAAVGPFTARARQSQRADTSAWDAWTRAARRDYEAWIVPGEAPGPLDLGKIFHDLRDLAPADTIFTTDAGNFAGWAGRYFPFHRYRTLLGATNGAMGYGMPAAVAAKVARPSATVICYAGDGGILMTGNELATAVHHNLAIVLIIANNSMYGTIRMHQERDYPGRTKATNLTNPDFVEWAKSFGASGERVETTEQFAPAFERALAADGPAVIELVVSEELLSSNMTLTQLRERVAAANAD
ncbi:MAG: thiamine pyrophosphate-binding protein [Alphaproteobacteria bacterium]|nr:thiamine pyrophosphate-binding protein [Alphaproteobacteria bacterium]MCZ6839669.1 thiamine pyrophosphate-binding protein [Alphaproteobacteria bacterium]